MPKGTSEMPTERLHHLGAVGLLVTVGLSASAGAASAPDAASRVAAEAAQAKSRIAFMTHVRNGPMALHVMNADGSGKRTLTRNAFNVGPPAWSADGQKLAFERRVDGNGQCGSNCNVEVHVMNADGSNERNLTRNPAWDTSPVWSPGGRKIAFVSTRDGRPAIYVMNADGSRQRNLTRGVRLLASFAWSPGRTH
jgi:Tol biopolymer transport system component